MKTKSLERIEERMGALEEGSIRYGILQSVKSFKTSWIDLGQGLYSVWKDRLYKEWGYATFDAYTSKEIGIKKATALKLLKSYYFLEKEEPRFLQKDHPDMKEPSSIPSYESINVLRLAKDKSTLDHEDYSRIKKYVLEMGKDAGEVKKDLTTLIKQREELEPDEARRKKKVAVIKRLLTSLKTLKKDIEISKMLPMTTLRDIASLISKIESEIN
ncbi:MAG: hypothetical protein WC592_03720 [Candidatus Omnitrophota bacterium]